MERTKVAIILHGLGPNGIDTLFSNLSAVWDESQMDITYFIAVDADNKQFWEEYVAKNGCKVVHLHDLDKGRLLKWPFTLFAALKKYGPYDVIHTNMDMLNGLNLIVARAAGVPRRICHSHVAESQYETKNGKNLLSVVYHNTMKHLIWNNATVKIGCSGKAMDYLYGDRWKQDGNSAVVWNGINVEKFRHGVNREEKLNELGLDTLNHYLLTVGRITAQKNVMFIVDIMNEIKRRKLPYKLLWCGKGDLEDQVRDKITELCLQDYIVMLGTRIDIPELMHCADLFILPSLFEGLGVVLIEAQAAGVVSLASDRVPQMVDCGLCDFLPVDHGVEIWCDAIESRINTNTDRDPDWNRINQYSIQGMKDTLQKIYKS